MITKNKPLIVIKETFSVKKGTIINSYTVLDNGIITEDSNFLSKASVLLLTEKLSSDDEKRVREIIKQQIRTLLWNLYTKQSMLVQ